MIRFLIFGILGILASVSYTAAKGAIREHKFDLTGQASLVLFPVFGLIALIYPAIAIHTGSLEWYGRGIVYMLAFYVVQFLVGLGLGKANACPWNYSGGGALMGIVRIHDAPLWFAAGLLIEWIYPFVKSISAVLH